MNTEIQGLGKIDNENIGENYCKSGNRYANTKRIITRQLNEIINKYKPKKIKIGKTGDFRKNRRSDSSYTEYNKVEMIYVSSSHENINSLEAYYISYVKKNYSKLTANVKNGSAGRLPKEGLSYVYVAMII